MFPESFGQEEPGGAGILLALQQDLEQTPRTAAPGPAGSTGLRTQELPQGQHEVILYHRREILQEGNDLGKQHQNLVRSREERAGGWKH